MKQSRWVGVLLIPALAALGMSAGCGGEKSGDKPVATHTEGSTSAGKSVAGKAANTGVKEELVSQGTGTLKGKVTFEGTPPAEKDIVLENNKDKDYCHMGDTKDFTWRVGKDKGVANVVVWLRAPRGKYFKLTDDEKKRNDVVKIDQPFCAFEPHVVTVFPSYFDGKKQEPTGEKFEVANSAKITHNTNWTASDPTLISGANVIIPAKSEARTIAVRPCKDRDCGKEQVVHLKCDIHTWMRAYAVVFDHPFKAVTKEDGTFEIKGVPAGADVDIMYWHETFDGPKKLETKSLKAGDNTVEIKLSK